VRVTVRLKSTTRRGRILLRNAPRSLQNLRLPDNVVSLAVVLLILVFALSRSDTAISVTYRRAQREERQPASRNGTEVKQRDGSISSHNSLGREGIPALAKVASEPSSAPGSVATVGKCPPLSADDLARWIDQASDKYGVSKLILVAVMFQESRFNPCATSPKGAVGIMQLMPKTAKQFALSDPFDPRKNIDTGAKVLKELSMRFSGDLRKVVAAYNAGPAAVERAISGVPDIAETANFVRSIEPVGQLIDPMRARP
jgi:hypothetical protein